MLDLLGRLEWSRERAPLTAPPTAPPSAPEDSDASGRRHVCVVTETYPPEVNGVALTLARLVEGCAPAGMRSPWCAPVATASTSTAITAMPP